MKTLIHKFFPNFLLAYHYCLALFGAVIYGFPSNKLKVIAVTGTKGKSTTVELISALLDEAGFKTAAAGTVRFKIGQNERPNLFKMTMPGRAFLQGFLREAVRAGCQYAIVEMTSEGARQFRHKFISLDTLVFTNIAPEHIESHGSFEKYLQAKLSIAQSLEKSKKKKRAIVANIDDSKGKDFLNVQVDKKISYSLKDAEPLSLFNEGSTLTIEGEEITTKMRGKFNIYNMLAAVSVARNEGVSMGVIKQTLEKFEGVRGRVEKVDRGQDFEIIVDYAHTPDSLSQLYETFKKRRKICVLGNTGGGRDVWKRPVMARIAEEYCEEIIFTDEDPYDEDPAQTIQDMVDGMKEKKPRIIMERRLAIRKAIEIAKKMKDKNVSILITGKGTDPYIMGPHGQNIPWNEVRVVKEELEKIS